MYEGSTPLEDFLDTLNRLQADFERRLGSIEREPLPAPTARASAQERSIPARWTQEDGYRPLGLEAIWTAARASPDQGPGDQRNPLLPRHSGTLVD